MEMMNRKSSLLPALLCSALALGLAVSSAFGKDTAEKSKEADKAVNAKCPVSGEDVDPSATVVHKGKTIAFCCEGCPSKFKKEPAKYLKVLEEQEKVSATKEGEDGAPAEGEEGTVEGTEPAEGTEGEPAGETEEGTTEGKEGEAKLNAKCPVSGDDIDP